MTPPLLDRPVKELLTQFPSMKRALFSHYHIGGCQSCSYDESITLRMLSETKKLNPDELVDVILKSEEHENTLWLPPLELKAMQESDAPHILLDTRTREEHEAVSIAPSEFLSMEKQNSLFSSEYYDSTIILYDHTGRNVMDTCSWFIGHGLKNTRALQGGIDLWSQEVNPSVMRYKLEFS